VIRTTFSWRVAMPGQDDLRLHLGHSRHRGVEVVDFEPEQEAVAIRSVGRVPYRPVVVFDLEAVELKDEDAIADQALIFRAAVCALTAKQPLIPPAAGLDIGDGDEWLGPHDALKIIELYGQRPIIAAIASEMATALTMRHTRPKRRSD
jgi:hypothetical protein